jgi:hypothetical protein
LTDCRDYRLGCSAVLLGEILARLVRDHIEIVNVAEILMLVLSAPHFLNFRLLSVPEVTD